MRCWHWTARRRWRAPWHLTELTPGRPAGGSGHSGPQTHLLPYWVPNVGLRLAAGEAVLAYTGDCGPSPLIAELARQADLLLAEASYVDLVPEDSRRYLSSASQAGGGPRRPEPGACC